MNFNELTIALNKIRPGSNHAAEVWNTWAKELEEMDSSNGELPEGTYKTADTFREEFVKLFTTIQEQYGNTVAGQVISLGDVPHCLFPWEMIPAARYLASGGKLEDIPTLSIEGVLEN